jgi:lipopolysaccharide transport system ATP-binding protein
MSHENIMEVRDVVVRYRTRRSFFRHDHFTALDGVSFDIRRNETLGIVGVNGCGKSTLLRVLANIYGIDRGDIIWNCDQVLLLSITLGFDEELSGRDNAIISGMLLGARKHEMLERMDEIIDFSELHDFIDKPIKTYSTGMRARLGFSVAVYVHPDLLLIDEVLGVGDGAFQTKAEAAIINKITSQQSVVLVSHDMNHIETLSNRVMWMHKGKIQMIGRPCDVVREYKNFLSKLEQGLAT